MRLGIENVARVADDRFANRAAFEHGVHRDLHVRHPVERIEHAEHVDPRLRRLRDEGFDDVVGVVRIADRVRGPQQHLKQDVRNPFPQFRQPLPGGFFQKPHRGVERRPAPHFDGEQFGAQPGVGIGDLRACRKSAPAWRAAIDGRRGRWCRSSAVSFARESTWRIPPRRAA